MHSDLEHEARLARLMRELPDEASQPYGFSEFQRRAQQRARSSRSRAGRQLLGAVVVVALAIVAFSLRFDLPARIGEETTR